MVVMKVPDDEQERLRFEPRVGDLARSGVTVLTIDTYDDLVGVLERLRAMLRPPRVIVIGSMNGMDSRASERVVKAAELLGEQLGQRNIPIAHGGSQVGAAVARRLAETASVIRHYDPTAITAIRRRVMNSCEYIGYPPGPGSVGMPRDGTIRFVGGTPEEMRAELARLGCVVAVIGGGPGTAEEVSMFSQAGLSVIPWPATGGTAERESSRLDALLADMAEPIRMQVRSALHGPDLSLGSVAMVNLLQAVQQPFADTGPTSGYGMVL